MTYGQVKSYILQLLNQATIAGGTVADNYNCQADYLLRIPHLINDAMTEIATTARKIPAVLDLSEIPPEEIGCAISCRTTSTSSNPAGVSRWPTVGWSGRRSCGCRAGGFCYFPAGRRGR